VKLTTRQREQLLKSMALDKKVAGGELKFVLARRIGEVQYGQTVSPRLLQETIAQLHS
jgi:3-dehydroquinate synthetase